MSIGEAIIQAINSETTNSESYRYPSISVKAMARNITHTRSAGRLLALK